ncbi:Dip2/Utp12 family-domain-containing protein [Lipomyces tetrasporus]|uniref:Dip2/Utp12 family-domain-containing protein n=1 Tax=Lipomyces tetrasporus TaxID=54092 RepID=A0AAD7QR51_9ASCO|nr:Dip2/Utp12 family-domain-containing protein [Lipomyces tetrasporus]KAJ8099929.1 Dip2/Utp12 family-domain-containing protein [Lipomyces tetrasporus]
MKPRATVVKTKGKSSSGILPFKDSETIVRSAEPPKDVDMLDASDAASSASDGTESENEEEITLADRVTALETKSKSKPQMNGKSPSKPLDKDVDAQAGKTGAVPTIGTLSTILRQALRTNDQALLESCLSFTDVAVVKQTIIRLDPTLSATLLERLAERIARTPSRASQLSVWIRWIMVAHGGYLVGLPGLVNKLANVRSTLARNAGTLNRLLALQGRLDMLSAQIELRREGRKDEEEEVDSDIEYVEGDEDEVVLDDAGYIVGEEEDEDEEDESESEDEEEADDMEDDDEDVEGEAEEVNIDEDVDDEDDDEDEDGDDDDEDEQEED